MAEVGRLIIFTTKLIVFMDGLSSDSSNTPTCLAFQLGNKRRRKEGGVLVQFRLSTDALCFSFTAAGLGRR